MECNTRNEGVDGVSLVVREGTEDPSSIIHVILSQVHGFRLVGTIVIVVPM